MIINKYTNKSRLRWSWFPAVDCVLTRKEYEYLEVIRKGYDYRCKPDFDGNIIKSLYELNLITSGITDGYYELTSWGKAKLS